MELRYKDSPVVIFISLAAIAVLGFIVYFNSLNTKFIWDDYYLVKNNTLIKSPSRALDIFKADIAAGSGRESKSYRPIQMLTYTLDYFLWKLDVRGYHITNIIIHILAAFSIYWFINILYNNRFLSLLTSLLFVAHPIHTEAVTYISGRADPLVGLFIILCLIFYIKYVNSSRKVFLVIALLSSALALLSRENAIIIPLLLILYHYIFRCRLNLKAFLSVAGIVLSYIALRLIFFKHLLSNMAAGQTTLFERIPGFFAAITSYLRILSLPLGLHMEYGDRIFRFADTKAILGIVILILLVAYLFIRGSSRSLAGFCIFWFFTSLLPSSNLYPITAYMAEHWLYIPSIGFFLLISYGLDRIYKIERLRLLAILIIVGLLGVYSFLTIRQNESWRKPILFYERTLKYAPQSWRVYNDLGLAYYDGAKVDEAIVCYKKALILNPKFVDAYNNLGIAYKAKGQAKEAAPLYKKAIELDPDYAMAYYNLANIYYEMERYDEAISLYNQAIVKNPHYAMIYYNLANAYRATGSAKDAEACYKKAIDADPGYAYPYNNLGILYYGMGKREEAIPLYKKALALDPNYVDALNNLGMAYYDAGNIDEAVALFKKSIEINPKHDTAYYNLSVLYYYQKDFKQAIRFYDEALKVGHKPNLEFLGALEPYRSKNEGSLQK